MSKLNPRMNEPIVRQRSWPASMQRTMHSVTFDLIVPVDERRSLAIGWLYLGLVALLAAGLFSILLVLSRTPHLQHIFPVADFFRVALVVHVDFSVLVWFLAFAGVLWSVNNKARAMSLGWGALVLTGLGAAAMGIAPFVGAPRAVMSNYIPVLQQPLFLLGLAIFAAGFALLVLRSMLTAQRVGVRPDGAAALQFGLNAAAVSGAVALLAFGWSYLKLPLTLDAKAYYELLFWGGGHVLQFTYTLMMMVAWLWLASAMGASVPLSPRVVLLLFAIGLVSVFATPVVYLAYDIGSVQHHQALTWLMRVGGGLAIGPLVAAIVWALIRTQPESAQARAARAALVTSLLLFSLGGLIGFAIQGSNVKIPAHYHGCIVGVTLALMGVTYHLLPRLGFADASAGWASKQIYLYAAGQLLHVAGLVWSGGYGVQRKIGGSAQVLRSTEEVAAMALMGLGGLVAIIGGIMFLVIVGAAIGRRTRAGAANATGR